MPPSPSKAFPDYACSSGVYRFLSAMLLVTLCCTATPALAAPMMSREDALQFMELAPDASKEAIKSRYKKLALKFHPDKGGSQEQFVKLQEAIEALKTAGSPEATQAAEGPVDFIVRENRFGFYSRIPRENRAEFVGLMNLWDHTVGNAFDVVADQIRANPNAEVSIKTVYDTHRTLMSNQLLNPGMGMSIDMLLDNDVLTFSKNTAERDSMLAAYLKELINQNDLVRFKRMVLSTAVLGVTSYIHGEPDFKKTNALLSKMPENPKFQEVLKEFSRQHFEGDPRLPGKRIIELARLGLLNWEDAFNRYSLLHFLDKKDQAAVEEILKNLPESFTKDMARIQLGRGSNSVIEMPILRKYAEKVNADQLPWSDIESGSFLARSKEITLDILIKREKSEPGYLAKKIQEHLQNLEAGFAEHKDDRRYDSVREARFNDVKKMHAKLTKEMQKREAAYANKCEKVFGG